VVIVVILRENVEFYVSILIYVMIFKRIYIYEEVVQGSQGK
jgi:hypothetical protein